MTKDSSAADGAVTVVIPAYKASKTLGNTLHSVFKQTVFPEKIIVVVNGNDETYNTAVSIKNHCPSEIIFEVIEPENSVLPVALNWTKASRLSDSEYTKLLCADDILEPTALEEQADFLKRNPNCAFVGSQRSIFDDTHRKILSSIGGSLLSKSSNFKRVLIACSLRGTNVLGEPSAVLFRTSDLQSNLPWNAEIPYVLDLEFYLRVLRNSKKNAGYISKPLTQFTISKNAWSTSMSNIQRENFLTYIMQTWNLILVGRILYYIFWIPATLNLLVRKQIYKSL